MTVLTMTAFGWVTLVVLAPWLPAPLAAVVYVFGGRICHQIAERSFVLDGAQLPVCARCVGIYAGAAAGVLVPILRHRASVRAAILLALMLNAITLAGASNPMRAAAGAVLGLAVGWAIRQAIAGRVDYERCRPLQRSRSALPESHT